jgi:hypothetical protein
MRRRGAVQGQFGVNPIHAPDAVQPHSGDAKHRAVTLHRFALRQEACPHLLFTEMHTLRFAPFSSTLLQA